MGKFHARLMHISRESPRSGLDDHGLQWSRDESLYGYLCSGTAHDQFHWLSIPRLRSSCNLKATQNIPFLTPFSALVRTRSIHLLEINLSNNITWPENFTMYIHIIHTTKANEEIVLRARAHILVCVEIKDSWSLWRGALSKLVIYMTWHERESRTL